MNRILVFHTDKEFGNSGYMYPSAYYIEADYEKVAVRIYAEDAPLEDAEFDIYDDGTSIFDDKAQQKVDPTTGVISDEGSGTEIILSANENSEEAAEDFTDENIEQGSWITCKLVNAGGGKNFTVQLELRQVSEDDERDD